MNKMNIAVYEKKEKNPFPEKFSCNRTQQISSTYDLGETITLLKNRILKIQSSMSIKSMALRERLQPFYILFMSSGCVLQAKSADESVLISLGRTRSLKRGLRRCAWPPSLF